MLTKNPDKGGLGLGTIGSSAVFAATLVAVILHTMRREDARPNVVGPPIADSPVS